MSRAPRRLADSRRPTERHQHGIAPLGAPERNESLNEREHQSQDQGELTNFRRHGLCAPLPLRRVVARRY